MPSKILIADDETYIRFLLQQTLEEFEDSGTLILTAENGEIALEIIRKEKPNLVFLDVMMPKVNGFEVCQMVKQDDTLKSTYIVMLTAKGQDFDRRRGEEVGANVFITKPFDPDELFSLTFNVLNHL